MRQQLLYDANQKRWLVFDSPLEIIETSSLEEVKACLQLVEERVEKKQRWAAGFLSYDAAPAFDAALVTRRERGFPLIWFGIYEKPHVVDRLDGALHESFAPLDWSPTISRADYDGAIKCIKELIAQGDTYQVNFTFRMRAAIGEHFSAFDYFSRLTRAHAEQYCAFIDTESFAVCSVSPELFFRLDGNCISTRPMKGTVRRGRTTVEDQELANWLNQSEKNRAENVMIVDMMRNDCGRIAAIGSVAVPRLFSLERYPTVWQMTSEVTARTEATFSEIMAALFPAASVTGAPKPRTMQIIAELESTPRRIYTGCVGFYGPKRTAQFNVAIRTVLIDREHRVAEYGVGGGIVWDSVDTEEFDECLTKTLVLTRQRPEFSLIETMLWTPDGGYFLLDYHLRRLHDSADYFGFRVSMPRIEMQLQELAETLNGRQRVRMLVDRDGKIGIQSAPITEDLSGTPTRLRLAANPISSSDVFLYHKTTNRTVYERARSAASDADDVIIWNERGEVTETCIDNIVVEKSRGRWVTPPIESGLLAGTYRACLLEQGKVCEEIVTIDELKAAGAIAVVNSVRGWRDAKFIRE